MATSLVGLEGGDKTCTSEMTTLGRETLSQCHPQGRSGFRNLSQEQVEMIFLHDSLNYLANQLN